MKCRICFSELETVFCDLGRQPIANALVPESGLHKPSINFQLRPMICDECYLVQLPSVIEPKLVFAEYPYFSSQSKVFVAHARDFVREARHRFKLGADSLVVEIASNDGYLLQHMRGSFGMPTIPCYGVEPAKNVAEYAIRHGIPTFIEFFNSQLVCDLLLESDSDWATGGKADLIVANNVLAHVPDLHSFLHGVRLLLKPEGVFVAEFPWLVDLVRYSQVGQIYHEHLSYFLLTTIERELGGTASPMRVFDFKYFPEIHGGSLRIYACHKGAKHEESSSVEMQRESERQWISEQSVYRFKPMVRDLKIGVWDFLLGIRGEGKSIAGYAAAAKATTLLNYCGVDQTMIPWVADTTPAKQGLYMPGSHIPIVSEQRLADEHPDVVWVLAPNHLEEVTERLKGLMPNQFEIAYQDGSRIWLREVDVAGV